MRKEVAVEGFEQSCDSQAKNDVSKQPEALGEAVDADLARIIEIWPSLETKLRSQIFNIAFKRGTLEANH